ncbi:mycothiol system anti-sigma-R factor [Arcanobacterium bovis]|uniref:Mycothiol system anti-sigma-R factor n=1 Tax=Arcanobacterium bovis TaxID=2529275 RepID=A0A4Q9UZW3_9ACTO|nr:mycothiol system anti-sigma-R factor [Arcanobacterium bovis]TBW21550.1 mycothiol system anti-sigma-R factor [Arcanobacterium bovis]
MTDNQHEHTSKIDELVDQLVDCQSDPNCSCGDVVDSLFELLDHEIPQERAEVLYTHGEECVNCSEQIAAEMRIREIVRRSCSEVAPSELRVRISQFIVQYRGELG